MIKDNIKLDLLKDGYCILKNVLNEKEILDLEKALDQGLESKNIQKCNYFNEDKKFWPYIANIKIINSLNNLLNEKVFFMDGGFSSYDTISKDTDENKISWHRDTDSAPQLTDQVPYCKENNFYKVFTVMTYLNRDIENTISLIPRTHKIEYKKSINNILRIIHWKTKNNKKVFYFRKFIEKIISKNIIIRPGDCLVFFVGLFHKPVAPKIHGNRKAVITRYAPRGINSENYIHYVLKNSSRKHYSDKAFLEFNESEIFIDFLKKNEILY
tara:strand:+ start:1515 stop:2324 length:810 start_codon:yes stop_codon:yes gene_type:complete